MDIRVDGKAAIVTGASRGIGLAIAKRYVESGGSVCITARKQNELDDALGELAEAGEHAKAGGRAIAVAGSADDPGHIADAVAKTVDRFGSLDALVNNAATNPQFGPLADAEPRAIEKVLSLNLEGPVLWVQEACRAWMRQQGGVILNIASIGGIMAEPMIGAYNVSKAALIHMTEQFAAELAPKVRVNALAPGLVKTQFAKALLAAGEEKLAERMPLKRLGVPDDVARAALFLLSDASDWITGSTLVIDGGALLGGFR